MLLKLLRRILFRGIRWASTPDRAPFASIGKDVWIVEPFYINCPEKLFLANNIYIGPHSAFNSFGGIRIGEGCAFGPFVRIYSCNHRYESLDQIPYDRFNILKPVEVGPFVWVGGDAIITPGVRLGEGAIVAAGAVVTKDVPAGAVVGGCPARVLKLRDMDTFRRLKAEGKVFRHKDPADGSIGTLPANWYVDAGLAVPGKDRKE